MKRVPKICFSRRLVVATTVLALAVGGAVLSQSSDVQGTGGGPLASTNNAAISEASALDSTFTERRTSQRSDLLLLAVMFLAVVWALPRREEALADHGSSTVSFGRLLLVRDRGPPCFV